MSFIVWVWLLGIAMAIMALLLATRIKSFTKVGSEMAAGLLLASFPLIFAARFSIWATIVAAVLHLWLLVLPARLYMGRLETPFLLGSTRINAMVGLAFIVVLIAVETWYPPQFTQLSLVLVLVASVSTGLFFLGQLMWNMRHYRLRNDMLPLDHLPTVSVCIPARNEDHALADCLATVLASDYPKLEVLVLDDCSQDKTSTIIRSFAHEGVRFVQGDQPALGWLGKNQAMQTLAAHASGDYVIFMDVDTHVSPQSVSHVVHYALANKLDMVSVTPQNRLGLTTSTLFNTLEQFWRIVLPVTARRVPVSSRFWAIKRASLDKLGGFASVSRKIVPEESFARRLFSLQTYRFLVSNKLLGVTTAKRWSSQIETSIRLAYPLLKRQPLAVLAAGFLLVGIFLVPFAVLITEVQQARYGAMFWLSAAAVAVFLIDYYLAAWRIQPRVWWLTGLLWPLVVIQEFTIYTASMVLYEFAEVNWKGRNVCYPVLTSQLPSLAEQVWRRS